MDETNYEGFTIVEVYLSSLYDNNPTESMEEKRIYRRMDNDKQNLRDKLFRFSFVVYLSIAFAPKKEGTTDLLRNAASLELLLVEFFRLL